MRWLVLNIGGDYSIKYSYYNAITIGYLLNFNVVSVGMNYKLYSLEEDSKNFTFESKMRLLSDILEPGEITDNIIEAIKCTKDYQKTKNKTSKQIVAYQNLKSSLLTIYNNNTESVFNKMNVIHGLESFRQLLNKDNFYFNSNWGGDDNSHDGNIALSNVLQLILPQSENETPIFIITDYIDSDQEVSDLFYYPSEAEEAEDITRTYLEEFCSFPKAYKMSVTELKNARNQLEEPTKKIIQYIDQWATICYQNPNTNAGLDFFRKEMKPILSAAKDLASESTIIKNHFKKEDLNTIQLFIGEADIDQIWTTYFCSNIINEETYSDLMTLRREQKPKYDGRYPIIYIKNQNAEVNTKNKTDLEFLNKKEDTVVSVRKTISID